MPRNAIQDGEMRFALDLLSQTLLTEDQMISVSILRRGIVRLEQEVDALNARLAKAYREARDDTRT